MSLAFVSPCKVGISLPACKRIDQFIQSHYIDSGLHHGVQFAIARHGKIGYWSSLGHADQHGTPLRDDSIFRVYSMTKPITTTCVMQLVERGLCQLTDPVSAYLPAFTHLRTYVSGDATEMCTSPCTQPMLIHHLLTHTAGLVYDYEPFNEISKAYTQAMYTEDTVHDTFNPTDRMRLQYTLEAFCDLLAKQPLLFEPGAHWCYGMGLDVAARIVEVISGMNFESYLRKHVLDPLGMHNSGFSVPSHKHSQLIQQYPVHANGQADSALFTDRRAGSYHTPAKLTFGGSGMVSSVQDYARFAMMQLQEGQLEGERILSRKSIALMTKNHLTSQQSIAQASFNGMMNFPVFKDIGQGLGVFSSKNPCYALGSEGRFGWGGGGCCDYWVDPKEDLLCVVMAPNADMQSRINMHLPTLVYSALDS